MSMQIQEGAYAMYQKVIVDGVEMLRPVMGGGMTEGERARLAALEAENAALKKRLAASVTIHVGGSGAGDTLIDGRGLDAGLPFETLSAAIKWAAGNCLGNLNAVIHGDVDYGPAGYNNDPYNHGLVNVYGDGNSSYTLAGLSIGTGTRMNVSGLTLQARERCCLYLGMFSVSAIADCTLTSGSQACVISEWTATARFYACTFQCSGGSGLSLSHSRVLFSSHNVFNGSCNAVLALGNCADVFAYAGNSNHSMTGNVTGKKYALASGSRLMVTGGASSLPGTQAGTCDASSTVA